MRRIDHRIVSRRGQKCELLDRKDWTKNKKLRNMYKHTYHEMVLAVIAEQLSAHPIWIDRYGKECSKKDALGCMVTHKLCYPGDRCFVRDEVGGNLLMKGNCHACGKLLDRFVTRQYLL